MAHLPGNRNCIIGYPPPSPPRNRGAAYKREEPPPSPSFLILFKNMRIQIHKPQSLPALGTVVLMASSVLAFQQDPTTESGQPSKMINSPVNEVPAQYFDRNFESFAPTVKKVAPAVVRIVTALSSNNTADLTSRTQTPLRSYVSGQVPRIRSGLGEGGLGSGVIVTEDGYILTTSHLVAGANEVEVALQDGRDFHAKVIGLDAKSDIAVIKIDSHDLPTVPL